MKDFSASLDMRKCKNGAHKIFSEFIYLKNCSASFFFPEHRQPHSWYPFWTPLTSCWRSRATEAQDFNPCRSRWQVSFTFCHWQTMLIPRISIILVKNNRENRTSVITEILKNRKTFFSVAYMNTQESVLIISNN